MVKSMKSCEGIAQSQIPYKSTQKMTWVMFIKIEGYQREELECDKIVMETILTPLLCLDYIQKEFLGDLTRVTEFLNYTFDTEGAEWCAAGGDQATPTPAVDPTKFDPHQVVTCNPNAEGAARAAMKSEIERYLSWSEKFTDPKVTMLRWWKVNNVFMFSLQHITDHPLSIRSMLVTIHSW